MTARGFRYSVRFDLMLGICLSSCFTPMPAALPGGLETSGSPGTRGGELRQAAVAARRAYREDLKRSGVATEKVEAHGVTGYICHPDLHGNSQGGGRGVKNQLFIKAAGSGVQCTPSAHGPAHPRYGEKANCVPLQLLTVPLPMKGMTQSGI